MKPQDAWSAAFSQLELQIDRASFETWLQNATYNRFEDGIFFIGVHSTYAQDMLQHRLYRVVRKVLCDVYGESVEIVFEVQKSKKDNAVEDDADMPLFQYLAQNTLRDADNKRDKKADHNPIVDTEDDKPQLPLYQFLSEPAKARPKESFINANFTFDRFVVNRSNQIVHEAARAIVDYPATVYNPFFVYGGVGLGKTHLITAITQACQARGMKAIYITTEAFTNDLIDAIRNRTTAMFRDKYRSVDVLVVDDVQFLAGKESTQEEFFHTFNTLVNFNKQIVLASDRHPSELVTLEDRLRSRFQGGLVADIQPPEYETRIAILQMWAYERDVRIEPEVLQLLAEREPNNVRELSGMFNNIVAQAQFGRVNVSNAETTIQRFEQPRQRLTIGKIIEVSARLQGVTTEDMLSAKRAARISKARQVAMYVARELTEMSLPQIGEAFGNRSHTTVLHGCKRITKDLKEDSVLEARILKIKRALTD